MAENYYYSSLTGAELDAALKQVSQAADYAGAAEAAAAQAAQTAAGLDSHCAPPIVAEAQGESIAVTDSSVRPLQGLKLFGKTTQNGTPTPDAPVELENVGSGGSIGVTVDAQTLTVSTPSGLPGIPVESGGNYTDENGQQWICDEIDLAKGVYVQRVNKDSYTGAPGEYWTTDGRSFIRGGSLAKAVNTTVLCTHMPVGHATSLGVMYFSYADAGISNMDEWRAWLAAQYVAGTPVESLYVLNTPIEMPLSAGELAKFAALHSNKPNTAVFNDAGAGMQVDYIADTKTYIDRKINALSAAMLNT